MLRQGNEKQMVYCSKLEKSHQERNVSIKSERRGCSAYQISICEHLTCGGSDIIGHTLPPSLSRIFKAQLVPRKFMKYMVIQISGVN